MPKRILIVEVNWIGDVLFSTPFIRAVREANPDAHIACLLHPRCVQVLRSNPRVNEIIIYDEEVEHKALLGKAKLILELRKKRFDTAFLLHRSYTKALIVYLAGIRERIGYPTKKRRPILTRVIEDPDEEIHKVEYFLKIARDCGMPVKDPSYEYFVDDADRRASGELLARSGIKAADKVVTLCPGGNWDPKRWPREKFASLGDEIARRWGARIVLAAAKRDMKLAEEIAKMMHCNPAAVAGKTTLNELGALLERSELVIANDTGSMHMAVAMKAKTIALFGPTSPKLTGPYGKGSYRVISRNETCEVPCYDLSCKDNRCMSAIKVEDVLRVAGELLGGLR